MTHEEQQILDYAGLAVSISRDFFVQGGDEEDLRQEALIGLWKAIRDYRPDHGTSRTTFYAFVVRRHLITVTRTAGRMKHAPLTLAARHGRGEDGDIPILDLLSDDRYDPVVLAELKDLKQRLELAIATRLTPIERHAIDGIRSGQSYLEMINGSEDPRRFKQIDNALKRARDKLALEVAA